MHNTNHNTARINIQEKRKINGSFIYSYTPRKNNIESNRTKILFYLYIQKQNYFQSIMNTVLYTLTIDYINIKDWQKIRSNRLLSISTHAIIKNARLYKSITKGISLMDFFWRGFHFCIIICFNSLGYWFVLRYFP